MGKGIPSGVNKVYREGEKARANGKALKDNPYTKEPERGDWRLGWYGA